MDIAQQIKPFTLVHGDNSTSLILGACEFQQAVFDERAADGFQGSGYDWASVAQVFLDEEAPELRADIQFDPEADMFCVYASKPQAIEAFALAFHAACSDPAHLRDLLSRAELD